MGTEYIKLPKETRSYMRRALAVFRHTPALWGRNITYSYRYDGAGSAPRYCLVGAMYALKYGRRPLSTVTCSEAFAGDLEPAIYKANDESSSVAEVIAKVRRLYGPEAVP